MSDADTTPLPSPPEASPVVRRSRWPTLLAWVVILGLVSYFVATRSAGEERRSANGQDRVGILVMRMQARYLLGMRELLGTSSVYEQVKALDTGTVGQRLRFVVLAGEFASPDEALNRLKRFDQLLAQHGKQFTPAQAEVHDILSRLYHDYRELHYGAPSISPEERTRLRHLLGWFGELALAPRIADARAALAIAGGAAVFALGLDPVPPAVREEVTAPAQRTLLTLLITFLGGCLVGLAGFVGLIVFLILVFARKVRGAFHTGTGHGGVYAETFALWLVLFAGFTYAGSLLPSNWPKLVLGAGCMLLSLLALGWPVLRGVPWRQVREDVGLTWGRPAVEPLCGVACYAMALPLLAVGMVLTFLLTRLQQLVEHHADDVFRPTGTPAHPIVEVVARGDWLARFEVLLLACVVAPLIEETMFRGVLFRHLREATGRWRPAWSFLFSATVVSFLFAVIHPQGIVAVPVLMALAYGFTMAREWRGTLLPAMVGHGLNNGLVMTMTMLAMGD